MTNTEVAIAMARVALEISDDCAVAGEIAEAHGAAYVARVFALAAKAEAEYGAWLAERLVGYSRDADWFANQCAIG